MSRKLRKSLAGIIVGCIGAFLSLAALHQGYLAIPENITFDLRARLLSKPGRASDQIRVILLDQTSLDWAKESFGLGWPWPRQAYAPLVNFCRKAGVASLAFDVVFTEPSVFGVNDDKALSDSLTNLGCVVLAANFARSDGSSTTWPDHIPTPKLTVTGTAPLLTAKVATFPIPDLAQNRIQVGNVNASPDQDTVYRRLPLLLQFNGQYVPALPLSAALVDQLGIIALTPDSMTVNGSWVPLTGAGEAILNYRGKHPYKTYSAAAVMESGLLLAEGKAPLIDLADFKDKYVLFGFSATGLFDLRPTPMGGVSPGVLVNATALDNFLSNDFMRAAPFSLDVVTTLFFAILAGLSVTVLTNLWLTVGASGVSLAAPIIFSVGTYTQGLWSGMATQLTSCLIALFLAGAYKYATEGRQKHFIKSAFKQYLSPQVIDQLLQNPEKLTLGGERRELTIFFSDLQGFTAISEKLPPEKLTRVLNDYLTAMTDIIHGYGGTVDKYEGDAIIAFWNAPLDQPDHAKLGVAAALGCQEKLTEMRPALLKRTGAEFHMRIGLNTGQAVVGNLGSHDRFDYTMIGDSVNLAARLESINKQFGTYTMISGSTLKQLGDTFPVRELSFLRVVGKQEAITVYEPMTSSEQDAKKETLKTFSLGLEQFYVGNFSRAVAFFTSIAHIDPAANRYAAKCIQLLADPPAAWDGVWTMTNK